jgi:hypothetical protein
MDTVSTGLARNDEYLTTETLGAAPAAVEWSVRVILILGFLAVLALEAYLIWEGVNLL